MFLSKTQSQNVPAERKKFSPHEAFLMRKQSNNSALGGASNSENIEASVLGLTPSKPLFDQSNLKNKQKDRTGKLL